MSKRYSAVCTRLIKIVGLVSFSITGDQWSSVYSLAVMPGCSERLGFDRSLRHRIFFQIANCHLFDPLLHLVANVISKLEMHEDMFCPWEGGGAECDCDQGPW